LPRYSPDVKTRLQLGIKHFFLDSKEAHHFADRNPQGNAITTSVECSQLRAATISRTRNSSKIFDEKGVFGAFCARHESPLGLIDIKYGERFAYGHFLLENLKCMNVNPVNKLHLYYDVACRFGPYIKVINKTLS
jgi:hypothetical protein